jgi:hypothetical protein
MRLIIDARRDTVGKNRVHGVHQAERIGGQANKNPQKTCFWGFRTETIPHAPRTAKEGFVKAIEAGLLTLGSSYWPTPSQRSPHKWRLSLAFVPDHSGASVRELHPLPSSSTSIAVTANGATAIITWSRRCQAHCDTGAESYEEKPSSDRENYRLTPILSPSIGTVDHVCYGLFTAPVEDPIAEESD